MNSGNESYGFTSLDSFDHRFAFFKSRDCFRAGLFPFPFLFLQRFLNGSFARGCSTFS